MIPKILTQYTNVSYIIKLVVFNTKMNNKRTWQKTIKMYILHTKHKNMFVQHKNIKSHSKSNISIVTYVVVVAGFEPASMVMSYHALTILSYTTLSANIQNRNSKYTSQIQKNTR